MRFTFHPPRRPSPHVVLIPVVSAVLLLASCAMDQRVMLHGDGSGSVHFRVTISKLLMSAASDLSQSGSSTAKPGEFNIPKIRKVFEENHSVDLESLSSPVPGTLTGNFTFSDVRSIFARAADPGGSAIITFTQTSSRDVLKVHITRHNFTEIARLAGMSSNPLYQMFGPEQNAATSVDDLNQMMVYVLGKSGPAALKGSSIDVVVSVNGAILGESGGVRRGNSVHFHIPLTRLLLLAKPLDYSITYS